MANVFKPPSNIPQDLLLIQELIADTTLDQRPEAKAHASESDTDISDSSSEASSSDISSSSESESGSDNELDIVEKLLVTDAETGIENAAR